MGQHTFVSVLNRKVFKILEHVVSLHNNYYSKFHTLFSFCSQIKCWFSESWNSQNACQNLANREDPDQTASEEAV